jgi:sterol desaturase/sphingolipid hydroxylase (fatty acid hydroxylase superfamily)
MFEKLSALPSPLQLLKDPVSIVVFGIFFSLMLLEELFPGRKLPGIRYWRWMGITAFVVNFFLATYLPMLWNEYLAPYQWFDLTFLGDYWGGLVALLAFEFGVYVWHRSMHKSDVLWRVFHQMHHSAERVDAYGAFYSSPADMIGYTILSSLILVLIGGFTPQAITYSIYANTFLAIFQHTNIKTPQWLGYIVQRPESHSMHHMKGVHAYNYSDLPLFDILFGTFRNPKDFTTETGFYDGASYRVTDMMMFRDINDRQEPEA